MIKIIINKKEAEVEEGLTVAGLLAQQKMTKAAVWINGKQLLQSEYDSREILPDDEIKILRIVAGG